MAPFGAKSTVLHGKRHPDSPEGATMPRVRTILATAVLAVLAVTSVAWAQDAESETEPPSPIKTYSDVANAFWDKAIVQHDALVDLYEECYTTGTERDDLILEMYNTGAYAMVLYDLALEYAVRTIDDTISAEGDARAAVDVTGGALAGAAATVRRWYDVNVNDGLASCLTPEEAAEPTEEEAS